MAALTQSFTLLPNHVVPFSGRPPGTDENNIFPRARIVFKDSRAIDLKLAGNTNAVTINMTLPANFFYTFDVFLMTFGSSSSIDVDNFDLTALQTVKFKSAGNDAFLTLPGVQAFESVAGAWITWTRGPESFSEVFGNQDGIAPIINNIFNDLDGTNNTDALTAVSYASFLQYDVMQADMVRVNAPTPVSVR